MTENLLLKMKEMTPGGEFLIGNMDGTGWCECKECALLDPPEEKKAVMARLVEHYDIDEVKVYEPSLNDIFVEYAGNAAAEG